jgi:hypothetical protein
MSRILFILVLCLSAAASVIGAVENDRENSEANLRTRPKPIIRNDFILDGVDGVLTRDEKEDKWFFVADTEITDTVAVIEAGKRIEMIPSNTLEGLISNANETQDNTSIKLWARVTKYHNNNYLFAWYYIPMTDTSPSEAKEPDKTQKQEKRTQTKEDQDSIIPSDIMAMLKPKRVVNLAKLKKVLETEGNALLVDRSGFIVNENGQKVFKLDGLGRNIGDLSFKLLPCEVLEWTEFKTSQWAFPRRHRIAGTVTKYQGEYYMLLQRAVRTYSHGNFVR